MTEPTPGDLAERARRIGADGGSEQDITDLIRDAEAGGEYCCCRNEGMHR